LRTSKEQRASMAARIAAGNTKKISVGREKNLVRESDPHAKNRKDAQARSVTNAAKGKPNTSGAEEVERSKTYGQG